MNGEIWNSMLPSQRQGLYLHLAPGSTVDYSFWTWEQLPSTIQELLRQSVRRMYAVTHVGPSGRTLTRANQGRNHFETREEAERALKQYQGPGGLEKVLTEKEMATLEVRWIMCYSHGDAMGIWFDNEHSLHESK